MPRRLLPTEQARFVHANVPTTQPQALRWLLPALLLVWIDHGADEDWGPMRHPPTGALPKPPPGDNRTLRSPR